MTEVIDAPARVSYEDRPLARSESLLIMPVAPTDDIVRAMERYKEVKDKLLEESDYQKFKGRDGKEQKFLTRKGFTKLATAYGISTRISGYEEWRDEGGKLLRARYRVIASAANGRECEGVGVCSASENTFRNMSDAGKLEHFLPATAFTRAKNRALADMFPSSDTSFEQYQADLLERSRGAARIGNGQEAAARADLAGTIDMLVDELQRRTEQARPLLIGQLMQRTKIKVPKGFVPGRNPDFTLFDHRAMRTLIDDLNARLEELPADEEEEPEGDYDAEILELTPDSPEQDNLL